MYCEFYQLSERPFNVTPDPKFLYLNARYREAVAALQYGITQRKGFITLIGEAGTGKTTLLKRLLDDLDPNTRTVFLFNTNVTFEEILEYIFAEFDLPVHSGKKLYMLQRLNAFLLEELSRGRNVALLIDEAQDLDISVLEDLRLLSNLETAKEKILQIVLSGQPELGQKLSNPALRQLRQRIGINCRLLPLSRDEVSEYIQFRLQAAGAPDLKLFTRDAEDQIYHFSRGIPRLVNVVCDNALVIGYALGKRRIGADIIKEAAADLLPLEGGEASKQSAAAPAVAASGEEVAEGSAEPRKWRRMVWGGGIVTALALGTWLGAALLRPENQPLSEPPNSPLPPGEVIKPGSVRDVPAPVEVPAGGTAVERAVPPRAEPARLAMLEDVPPAASGGARESGAGEQQEVHSLEASLGVEVAGLNVPRENVAAARENPLAAAQVENPSSAGKEAQRSAAAAGALEEGALGTAHARAEDAEHTREQWSAPVVGAVQPEVGLAPARVVESEQEAGGVWGGERFTRLVIREGDSLSGIARAKYGQASYTVLDLIKLANPEIVDVDWISPGQVLRLPDLKEGLPILRSEDGFALLVLSTPNGQRAHQLAAALRQRGFQARVRTASLGRDKKVQRVTVHAGNTQEEAARTGQALRKLLREDARIVQLGQ